MKIQKKKIENWHPSGARGFTLTELLVTIGIFVLVLGGAGVSFRQANLRRSVDDAAESLRQAILEARGQALAPTAEKVPGIVGYGWMMVSETAWEIREITGSTGETADQQALLSFGTTLETGRLPSGLTYRSDPPIEWIGFQIAPAGEIVVGPNFDEDLSSGVDLTVTRADIGRSVTLHVDTETGLADVAEQNST